MKTTRRRQRSVKRYTRRQRGGVEPVYIINPLHHAKHEIVRGKGSRALLKPPAKKGVRIAEGHLTFNANAANFPGWNPELGHEASALRKGHLKG